ncbi:3-mercaptopyruvate sulfurtransferase [Halotia wernerae UHCC 0503]|nr:3-mercaptopyruvate sulfurtransferase [Halotia wernerae UHCC 0503]
MDYAHPESLVSTEWLAAHLGDKDIRVLDGTYHLPTVKRDARAEFAAKHIPGAAFFDIDGIADHTTDLPHMLPSPEAFQAEMRKLGISAETRVIVYDVYGFQSAARAWWSLRIFGHDNVALLDGGLPKWLAENRPTEGGAASPAAGNFVAKFRPDLVRSKAQIVANIDTKAEQVLDARAAGRFEGTAPEPRAGLRGGHIPGSRNLPMSDLVEPATKQLKSADDLAKLYAAAGIDTTKPIATTCGSGVTACGLAFGLHLIGIDKVAIYDGSWSEWGLPDGPPIATGPA